MNGPQHLVVSLVVTLALPCALAPATKAAENSTATEAPPPDFVFDMVPPEAPADRAPVPSASAPPAIPAPAPKPTQPPAPQLPPPQPPTPPPSVVKPRLAFVTPEIGEVWYEGDEVTLRWEGGDPKGTVRLYFYGERCKLGGRSRGTFDGVIKAGMLPNTGKIVWEVPWLDGTSLNLTMAAYDERGKLMAQIERKVTVLPREFKGLPPTCIAVSKRLQRLYYFKNGEVKRMHIVSTAAPGYVTPRMKPGSYSHGRGYMGRVFYKALNPLSREYHVYMPYWLGITSSGSHGIHATSPRFYSRLGQPASHGCIRQHRNDAKVLYDMVPVGTPVYVF